MKIFGSILILALVVFLLIMNTPVTHLGSGFLVGDNRHLMTYYDLVKEADDIRVKFPNEDDIQAKLVFKNPANNLAILELGETPKVKREPLSFADSAASIQNNAVFTLGYPWTNTLEDKHTLIEGVLSSQGVSFSDLIPIDMALDPVHSGSPLIDQNRQVVGMVLMASHIGEHFPEETPSKTNFAIPVSTLIKNLQSLKSFKPATLEQPNEKGSMQEFIERVKNNVVLVEAR